MSEYEIYWSDLTEEAKDRLQNMYHHNINEYPIAIIIAEDYIEDDIEVD